VKIKSFLTYEGIRWPTDHDLFTKSGVAFLHGLNLAPVESYLRIMCVFEIKILSNELKGLAEENEEVKLLMSIPGIGYYSALLVKSEIGDVSRFPFGEKLCSYAGLVSSTYASGGVVSHGRITKEGSKWLHWVIIEVAQVHVNKYDTAITRAYQCIAGRRGKKAAKIAVARKLLLCCFSVLKNKRPFHDQT
jgi:transposase